jgi:dipeptidyl aminopeptidase/acylaminoacyl peptidase
VNPDQLGDFRTPSDPQLHPSHDRIAFVVSQMDLVADEYVRQIWQWDGASAGPFTSGKSDTSPRWSPSGDRLAFIRKADDEHAKPQVAVMSAAGGEAVVVSDFELGVREIVWLPDGSGLIVVAAEWIEGFKDLDKDEMARLPRRIDEANFRGDNQGYTYDRKNHVWWLPLDGSDPVCLTPGDFNESGVDVAPDGSAVVFLSARHDPAGVLPGASLYTVSVNGSAVTAVTGVGSWGNATYGPKGDLYAAGSEDMWDYPTVFPLNRLTGDGLEPLTSIDYNLVGNPPGQPRGPFFLDDGRILSTLEFEGRTHVVSLEGDSWTTVVGGDRWVGGFSVRPDGSELAFVASEPTDPGDLFLMKDGTETRLTDLNAEFKAAANLVAPQEFTIDHDGVSIAGWVYLPAGEEKVPLLYNIHGGPATQYGYGFFDEFQVYAGAGYGVVATNPRGSSGYGRDHVRAAIGRWHEEMPPDLLDILAAVDVAADAFPRLDKARMGVMGGSYGGWATAFVVAHDQRFKSAVAERGLYNWISFYGTSDIGPWFPRMFTGLSSTTDIEKMWNAGPLSMAHLVSTPTLVLHSEADFRCPIEQGEQFFTVLKSTGCEAELVRFPAPESHELSRGGSPKHRKERFEIILGWHGPRLIDTTQE